MTNTDNEIEFEDASNTLATDGEDGFAERLKKLIALNGTVNALAKKAGISHSGLLRYLSGGDPSRKVLVALAEAANVDLVWLATGRGQMTGAMPKQSLTMLPLYDVSEFTGNTVIAQQDKTQLTELAFCRFWLNRNGLDSGCLKAMMVRGDSMAPCIVNGDTILIDETRQHIIDGKIYLIRDHGNLLLKRVQWELHGRLRLLSDNHQYREFDVAASEVEIVGQVVWGARLM